MYGVPVKYVTNVVCEYLWKIVDCNLFEVLKVFDNGLLWLPRHVGIVVGACTGDAGGSSSSSAVSGWVLGSRLDLNFTDHEVM